jgi:hypothetical protein
LTRLLGDRGADCAVTQLDALSGDEEQARAERDTGGLVSDTRLCGRGTGRRTGACGRPGRPCGGCVRRRRPLSALCTGADGVCNFRRDGARLRGPLCACAGVHSAAAAPPRPSDPLEITSGIAGLLADLIMITVDDSVALDHRPIGTAPEDIGTGDRRVASRVHLAPGPSHLN